jgi:hypothetical protein
MARSELLIETSLHELQHVFIQEWKIAPWQPALVGR